MTIQLIQASAHHLPMIPDASVHVLVTSPPYYSLRRYEGSQDIEWPTVEYSPMPGLPPIHVDSWRGPLGLEPTIEMYMAHLVLCLREWWRILRPDATAWVNLADSYAGGGTNRNGLSTSVIGSGPNGACKQREIAGEINRKSVSGLRPKSLCLIPARFALAAQAEGWILRSAITWCKSAAMPESVRDRPTRATEQIFLLAKQEHYYYDQEAIREPLQENTLERYKYGWNGVDDDGSNGARTGSAYKKMKAGATMGEAMGVSGRNMRDWQIINPEPTSFAHFATFPSRIPEIAILAGTSAVGCCAKCGAGYTRVVEREAERHNEKEGVAQRLRNAGVQNGGTEKVTLGMTEFVQRTTTGWQPSCSCNAGDPVPAVVCDPFSGSGTTGKVALRLGRSYIGVDLSQQYLDDITAQRLGAGVQMQISL